MTDPLKPPASAAAPAADARRGTQRAEKRARSAARQAWREQVRGPVDAQTLRDAIRARREQVGAQTPPRARAVVARAMPDPTLHDLWLPIGPTSVIAGQASGRPRVAGRVNDIHVSPDGLRVYAATANGGVWFSSDAGESWQPLGGWITVGAPPVDTPSGVLACGCLYVRFGGNAGADEVLVGTGETQPGRADLDPWVPGAVSGTPGSSRSGVGVLRANGPASAGIYTNPWSVEATNLAEKGIYRIAANPAEATPSTFVAATSAGLWTRTGAPAATWTPVPGAPFADAAGQQLVCTDVCWTSAALLVAVRNTGGVGPGLYRSTNGPAGPFAPIALPGIAADSRITLAAAPSDPNVVYALGNGNLVWRIDAAVPLPVQRIPATLLGGQDSYNQGIGVHPTRPERLVLGGGNQQVGNDSNASLYLANVSGPTAGAYRYGFVTTAVGADPTVDDAFVGHGVHADVHCTRFVRLTDGSVQLWIGCDGGVYRSLRGDADNRVVKNSFVARNNGIASLECGFVASHPIVDGHLLVGTQDNGTLERIGLNLWRAAMLGDGGGLAYNPASPNRFALQYIQSAFLRGTIGANGAQLTQITPPVYRQANNWGYSAAPPATNTPAEAYESGVTSFYSGMDAIAAADAVGGARLAVGTYRVWMTQDWGNTWATLPGLTDPMALGSQTNFVDPCVTTAGQPDGTRGQVVALRWASATRLYALCQREVIKYDLVPATAATPLTATATMLTRQNPHKKEDPQDARTVTSPGQRLPEIGAWSDIGVHDPARGAHGSFYVAATGDSSVPAMDTLWWFDGSDRWIATGLRGVVPAPAYAAVVDPGNRNIVYVGNAVGVWRGTFDGDHTWAWAEVCNGLPEATVHDLSVFSSGGVRLLRAAVQARGVWELDLVTAAVPARTMLRVHAFDTRRASPSLLHDPTQPAANTALSWHASPDLRVRPERGARPPAPLNLPWTGSSPDRYGLWVFQTALHARGGGDPLVKPDGNWTPLFERRLADAVAMLPGSQPNPKRINQARWDSIVGSGSTFPDAYADPWNGTSPSEADLFELIIDRPATGGSTASMGVGRVAARVDVQVHHRHVTPASAASVKVTLLMRNVSGSVDTAWAALATAWTAPVQNLLRNGGALPVLADGWSFADAGTAVRSPSADVDVRLSRVVTFNVNLALPVPTTTLLLVAVVHSTADPVTLAGATLRDVVLGCRHVAARSVSLL